jgi:predicted small secreted protein
MKKSFAIILILSLLGLALGSCNGGQPEVG